MKKTNWTGSVALAALAWGAPGLAQDAPPVAVVDEEDFELRGRVNVEEAPTDILVSASRAPTGIEESVAPITNIRLTAVAASIRQTREIADALRDFPSVAVSSVAGQTQLRLRGSEANHVLVLIDGIEVSDPFAGEFDIGTLQGEIGSHAELLLGPQSALYGSDAIGGVLSYFSPRGCDGTFEGYAEGGTNATFNASARAGLCGTSIEANLSATYVSTDGEPNARDGVRDVGRESATISANLRVFPTDNLTLRAVGRYVSTKGDFNDQDFAPGSPTFGLVIDSPDTRFDNEALYALVGAELVLLDDRWVHDLSVQIADIARDSFGPFGRVFGNEGERLKGSYLTSLDLRGGSLKHRLTFAADWEEERYRNTDPFGFAFTGTRANENVGLVGEYQLVGDSFLVSAAVRHDFNDNFADAATFRIAGSIDLSDSTRLRGAVGTGIKNPGFYELFGFVDGRFIGNADLRPEKATGWEIGIDQEIDYGTVELSAVYFESELEDEIFTNFPPPNFIATPANRDTVSTRRGIELSGKARLTDTLTLTARYTHLDSEEDGVTEVRRPENIAAGSLDWTSPKRDMRASLVIRHNGEAEDLAFTDPSFIPLRVTLEDYTLVNLYGEADLAKGFTVFGRVENLLDDRYEQVFSFVSPGLTAVAGIRLKL